jgi:hypothetical protein
MYTVGEASSPKLSPVWFRSRHPLAISWALKGGWCVDLRHLGVGVGLNEVSSIGCDAIRELGVSPPRHSWQGTMQGEFSVPGCGLCCLPGVRLYRGSRGLCCTVRCGVEL